MTTDAETFEPPLVCEGGCHCGAVRYRVVLRRRFASECTCSICRKKGAIHYTVPDSDFTLLSSADAITTYQFNQRIAKHMFCRTCGVHSFCRPRSQPDKIEVNLRCLDEVPLERLTILSFDGANWERTMGLTDNSQH